MQLSCMDSQISQHHDWWSIILQKSKVWLKIGCVKMGHTCGLNIVQFHCGVYFCLCYCRFLFFNSFLFMLQILCISCFPFCFLRWIILLDYVLDSSIAWGVDWAAGHGWPGQWFSWPKHSCLPRWCLFLH